MGVNLVSDTKEHRMRVSEKRMLRGIFVLKNNNNNKKKKCQEAGEDCIMRSFITCTLHQMLLGCSHQGG
jgi:hypothetical protein